MAIGLVIGCDLPVGTIITDDNWNEYVAGLVMTNCLSAHDIELSGTQYFESKAHPTFISVGPALVLLDRHELERFRDLWLQLDVNGVERHDAVVAGETIFPPVRALQGPSRFQRLGAGDLVLTGPAGTGQARNDLYLSDRDVIAARVATDDVAIDLGEQRRAVKCLD